MQYTAVIRTLGTAGEKYQKLLDSICAQTLKPDSILVYIAEGYPLPKETCGIEKYIYVKKGMVAQRALPYNEVTTEYILFLDDDLSLPHDLAEKMFYHIKANEADIIAADVFPNDERGLLPELMMTLSGRMRARRFDRKHGYKVMASAGFSYNKNPKEEIYLSNTNAGACFLCKKSAFLKIKFTEELWMDKLPYAIGDDQIMFYKMHLMGFKQLTYYHSGIKHLDGGNNLGNKEKERRLVESDYYFRTVFFQRFLLEPEKSIIRRLWKRICISYFFSFGQFISIAKGDLDMLCRKRNAIKHAKEFIKSHEYKILPNIIAQ